MKKILFLLTIAVTFAACGKPSDASNATTTDKPTDQIADNVGDGGNAGDLSQPNTMASSAEDGEAWAETYQGTIDGKIEAKIDLVGLDETVRGTITYKKSGKPILLLGNINSDGTYFLREYQPDGLVTGLMSGKSQNGKLTGNWYGNNKDLKMAFTSNGKEISQPWPYDVKGSIAGEYVYNYPKEGEDPGAAGGLTVKVKGDQVTFGFECITGPPAYHVATIEDAEGTLEEGNLIRYSSSDFGDCAFQIHFYEGFAIVSNVEGKYDCGFGMNAGVEGEYVKVRSGSKDPF